MSVASPMAIIGAPTKIRGFIVIFVRLLSFSPFNVLNILKMWQKFKMAKDFSPFLPQGNTGLVFNHLFNAEMIRIVPSESMDF